MLSSWGMEKYINQLEDKLVVSLVVLTDAENREGTRAARAVWLEVDIEVALQHWLNGTQGRGGRRGGGGGHPVR